MKIEDTRNYWFGILPHVYYSTTEKTALLYNTRNGYALHVSNAEILHLLEQMYEKKNLGVVEMTGKDLLRQNMISFIDESVKNNLCFIREYNPEFPKPVQLMPILNLQKDVEKLSREEGRSLGEGILQYLSDITLYLNSPCSRHCSQCSAYYKQFFHCTWDFQNREMDFDFLKSLLKKISWAPIRRLAITGGNPFTCSYFKELIAFLRHEKIFPLFGIHYLNVDLKSNDFFADFQTEILIPFPVEEDYLEKIILLPAIDNLKLIFEISSQDDYNFTEIFIQRHNITNYDVRPFYNHNNDLFFEENVYLTREDLFSDPILQRIIFAHQKLNTNFFGSIHIFPNGDVKANPNKETLGNLHKISLQKILEKELIENTAWRIIREKGSCGLCLYRFLCPSPSNYEFVIGKNNLCNIE